MTQAKPATAAGTTHEGEVAARLLAWYDRHHRVLPWRVPPDARARGEMPDPYRVWLSEIMLQQTTVKAAGPYFTRFVDKWPNVAALAAAGLDDVMKAWAGLGYYSRARNLKKCAEAVVADHGGTFPGEEAALAALPGIGPYTAAAIAAIAFNRPAAVVDGNVERVVARLEAVSTPLPEAKRPIRAFVAAAVPASRPGDFAQAMMDLGATICTPRRPACALCPLGESCAGLRLGDPEALPVKAPKAERPLRRGAAFVAVRGDGAVLLRKRPPSGLLGGMSEVPTSAWSARRDGAADISAAPFAAGWRRVGAVSHVFTHFTLELAVFRADTDGPAPAGCWWSAESEIGGEALPSIMRKVVAAASPDAFKRQPFGQGEPQ